MRAKWDGDVKTEPAESPRKIIKVLESAPPSQAPPDITLYATIAVAAIIIVAIGVYFVKFRKR